VIDLIGARSARALEAANQQLRGSLGRHMTKLTDGLLMILARIEAYIDFPEEDLPAEDRQIVMTELEETLRGTKRLLATQHYGDLLRDGIKTVIVGAPNAGKSSLLNALVGQERALVSPEPGTTRDFIEERVILGPHCIRLIDTAGLRAAEGAIEKLGIQKTVERAAEADLFLWVVDAVAVLREREPKWPTELGEMPAAEKIVLVLNKADLLSEAEQRSVKASLPYPLKSPATDLGESAAAATPANAMVSTLSGLGLEELIAVVVARAESFNLIHGEETIAINARHADALRRADQALVRAQGALRQTGAIELISSDIREGLDALGEIAGRIDNERMLDHLFSTFCIGK
jgi:tRNA modification GTPase